MGDRVAVVGAQMWTPRLAATLEKHTDTRCSPVSELKRSDFFRLLLAFFVPRIVRVGFRPGQLRPRGLMLDIFSALYLLVGGDLVFYWTGSDLLRTARMLKEARGAARLWSAPLARYLMARSRHCVAAPWLEKELLELGFKGHYFAFPTPTKVFEEAGLRSPGWPEQFVVLTYIPDHNFHNYCGVELIRLAREMPEVQFRVMGGRGDWCDDCPDNVTFLGWANALEEYLGCVVVIRAVRHDALGGTVREGLLCGRYAFYTCSHEHAERLPDPDHTQQFLTVTGELLRRLLQSHSQGRLSFNEAGRDWVLAHLTERVLAEKLAGYLNESQ